MRPLRPAELGRLAAWSGADERAAETWAEGWRADLAAEPEASVAVDADGGLAGGAVLRCWGRVAGIPALVVRPDSRGRGIGTRLLRELADVLLRRDVRTALLELESTDDPALPFLLARDFKVRAPTLRLALRVSGSDAPELEPAGEDPIEIGGPGLLPRSDELEALAPAVDADLRPLGWLAARAAAGERVAAWPGAGGSVAGLALLPRPVEAPADRPEAASDPRSEPAPSGVEPEASAGSLDQPEAAGQDPHEAVSEEAHGEVRGDAGEREAGGAGAAAGEADRGASRASWEIPFLLVGETEPFAALEAALPHLVARARAEGAAALTVHAPGRHADLLRHLTNRGFRPAGHRLRLSLAGHPERADLRRGLLCCVR